jgi:diaminohydroxyphosphoribosylaminopyrimidine deaminase / 5-amino-6-(5-phosphoribosylamino)uracil reductase
VSRAIDEAFMRRAIDLARTVAGTTGSNPPVGAIIVARDEVVGQGATGVGGRPHAEEQALGHAGGRARGGTAYVTMEPCGERSSGAISCADRLAMAGVARVVFSAANPDPLSAGRGPQRLRAEGVAVESGFLADQTQALYADFVSAATAGRQKGGASPRRPS